MGHDINWGQLSDIKQGQRLAGLEGNREWAEAVFDASQAMADDRTGAMKRSGRIEASTEYEDGLTIAYGGGADGTAWVDELNESLAQHELSENLRYQVEQRDYDAGGNNAREDTVRFREEVDAGRKDIGEDELQYTVDYAVYRHEGTYQWRTGQRKFLEVPVREHENEHTDYIARRAEKRLGDGR